MKKKKEKTTPWAPTADRFVAFLDILGFKEMVMRNTHEYVYDKLKSITDLQSSLVEVIETIGIDEGEDVGIKIVNFSDSIIIFSKNNNINNFKYFMKSVSIIVSNAISGGVPMKGGLAYGEISLNQSAQIYFGQPIIDAFLLEEDVKYFGVVAHNSIDKYISDCEDEQEDLITEIFFEEKTPLKSGNITHLNIDWFEGIIVTEVQRIIRSFRLTATGSARIYIDNTLDIFEKLRQKKEAK